MLLCPRCRTSTTLSSGFHWSRKLLSVFSRMNAKKQRLKTFYFGATRTIFCSSQPHVTRGQLQPQTDLGPRSCADFTACSPSPATRLHTGDANRRHRLLPIPHPGVPSQSLTRLALACTHLTRRDVTTIGVIVRVAADGLYCAHLPR